MPKIDPSLVAAAQAGSPEAIEHIISQAQIDLMAFARHVCATPQDAEDAVQETLWIISRQIGSVRTVAAFTTWMFRIVRHQCYRFLRKARREVDVDALETENATGKLAEGGDILALQQDVAQAIAGLPEIYRSVLIKRDLEALSTIETAAQLGLSVEAVKSRLHRSRGLMRIALQNWS
jgi:RNA polymerase sigma factor (sigma-70 family)